jgi:hypothetical protein
MTDLADARRSFFILTNFWITKKTTLSTLERKNAPQSKLNPYSCVLELVGLI